MSANPHAGLPITDDDAAIEAMLADLSMPTLMLSLVHMTGDAGLIRSEIKPQGLFLNEVQGFMPEPMQAEIRKLALEIIKKYRDGGPLIFHSECQMRYITGCLKALIEGEHKAMEPKQEVHDEYYERTQKELEGLVWSHPSIDHSWYKNSGGKIRILSPWRLVDYWAWTREPDPGKLEIV